MVTSTRMLSPIGSIHEMEDRGHHLHATGVVLVAHSHFSALLTPYRLHVVSGDSGLWINKIDLVFYNHVLVSNVAHRLHY